MLKDERSFLVDAHLCDILTIFPIFMSCFYDLSSALVVDIAHLISQVNFKAEIVTGLVSQALIRCHIMFS